ncbi:hypothetical protein AYO20_01071 [Fonsecaea nubica]|uniref:Major facilitator superfamily (MFS) profile domain-containing protein n=1 Tax=Fonsecaea nubica TaxID=856822 RepID=A0A178DEB4_9EURO|nr:hypothetical protein AYO20_01071 [Fonsecaea nubica]OAL39674.1 hypothetical protein AYO20_01071 [Fonsecaea nubica]
MATSDLWTAVVTGGASGIGAATSKKLASRGINVLIADVQDDLGEKLAEEIKATFKVDALFLHVDVSKEEDVVAMVKAVVDRWGRLDYAANIAGFCRGDRDDEVGVSTQDVDSHFAVNQRGVWLCQKFEAAQMLKQSPRGVEIFPAPSLPIKPQRGAIVNIGSTTAVTGMGFAAYAPTKAAVLEITRNGAFFYGPQGIRCNAVCPGATVTPLALSNMHDSVKSDPDYKHEGNRYTEPIALKVMACPEEQASVISFLLSPESSHITGQTIMLLVMADADQTHHHKVEGLLRSAPSDEQLREHVITDPNQEVSRLSIRVLLSISSISFIFSTSLGTFLCLVPVLGNINEDLGPDPSFTWIASSWTVATGVGLICAGSLSDIFGRRWFTIGTGVLGVVASILGLTSHSIGQMIATMTLFGLNQAGAVNGFASVSELVPTKYRGPVVGIMNLTALPFDLCGSLIARSMILNTGPGWKSVFWMALAANIAGTVACAVTYFPAKPLAASASKGSMIRDFDYVGLGGIIVGPTLVLLGVIWVPQYGATSAHFLAPFLIGVVTLVALGFYEAYIPKAPLLHPFLFKRVRTFTMILVVSFVGGMMFYALQANWPTFLTIMYTGDDLLQAGVYQTIMGASTLAAGAGSAVLLPWIGPKLGTTALLSIGVVFEVIFIPLMSIAGPHNKAAALTFSFFAGVGIGITTTLPIVFISLCTPDEWIGFATASMGLSRYIGGSAGTAIYTTALTSKASVYIPQMVTAAATQAGLPLDSVPLLLGLLTGATPGQTLASIPGITTEIFQLAYSAFQDAYQHAFRYVFYTSIPFGIVALAAALATKDLSSHLTMKVAQRLVTDVKAEDATVMKNAEHGPSDHEIEMVESTTPKA